MRSEQQHADPDRRGRSDQDSRGGDVLRCPGARVDRRARQRDRVLDRGIHRLEDEHRADREHERDPLPTLESQQRAGHESEHADAGLKAEVALGPQKMGYAGERESERAQERHTVSVTDTGILARDSVARRLNRESFLLLGGTAALLLQVAHPLVAAGVAEHSGFRRDPFGRLMRTLNTTLGIVFGTTAQARAGLRRIDRRHVPVRGALAGRPYDAHDPALLVWVQVTLVLTSLRLFELVRGRLSDADRETYWAEARMFAGDLGATQEALPSTYGALIAYERYMLAHEAIPDASAIAVARDVLRPIRLVPGPIYWLSDAFTAGLLPPSIRLAIGLSWRTRERLWFRFVIAALRLFLPVVPTRIRVVPQARLYEARLG